MNTCIRATALVCVAAVTWAAGPPYAITNARIVLAPGKVLDKGIVLMRDGLVEAVGENVPIPADARVYDGKGLTVYPGFIDAGTNFGFAAPARPAGAGFGAGAAAAPGAGPAPTPEDIASPERFLNPKPAGVNAIVNAAEKMTIPAQPDPRRAQGFTTLLSVPREGNWQGTSALVNLAGGSSTAMVVKSPVAMHVSFGTQALRQYPSSLMGVFAVLRQSLLTALQYRDAVALYEKSGGRGIPRPAFDATSAALLPVLEGKIPVVFRADSAEEIRRALRFAAEFKLRPVIQGASEAWRVADLLKSRGVPVLVDLSLNPPRGGAAFGGFSFGGDDEPQNSPRRFAAESNPGRLEKAGVRFAFATAGIENAGEIPAKLRRAIARGLSKEGALRAMTTSAADILGAGAQMGSIEVGKIANLALIEGEALDPQAKIRAVVIDGQFEYAPLTPAVVGRAGGPAGRERAPVDPVVERTPPQPEPAAKEVVIQNANILTVTKGTIENGSILIRDGRIAEVGKSVLIPAGAKIISASGRWVMPGIIDSHSHSATSGGVNESAPAISSQARIEDVLDPEDIDLYRALAAGVTTLNILHGSANAIGGQNATVKLKWGYPASEMLFKGAPPGIKMALGENPKRSNFLANVPRYPSTRMGVEFVIRESFTRAREYQKAWKDYEARKAKGDTVLPPARNLTLDALVEVLEGKRWVHAHCYRADEISMLLDLADEFGFKIRSLQHVLEGYKVTEKIKKHGAGASTFADNWGYKMEAFDGTAYNTALMAKAGIRTAVNSDSDERARRLYQEAAKGIKYGGLTEEQALKLITLDAAWMMGIDSKVGSIEVGKDADLAIFNGHPFSPYARVEMTLIEGQVFFDRERDLKSRVPWKEEFEAEPEQRPAGAPSAEARQ